jgi:hypothetical protein
LRLRPLIGRDIDAKYIEVRNGKLEIVCHFLGAIDLRI